MKKYKYIIFGAGPSGLAFAHQLLKMGEESFIVLEKEEIAGGLCRSEMVDGAPLDTGGGHFLDVKHKDVLDLLFEFLPEHEWQMFDRVSKINLRNVPIDYPLEANLWQLPISDRIDFLESIAQAGCVRGEVMPESFEDWIKWKLGLRIAEEYMLPYNRKIWSIDLKKLGTYWLYKLPDVSFRETLLSCLDGAPKGKLPAHGRFLYPKQYGYGEVWRRMGLALKDKLICRCQVDHVNLDTLVVNNQWQGDNIITSIPWTLWPKFSSIPGDISTAISCLKNAAIDVDYYSNDIDTDAQWIYEPDENESYHRILVRHNFVDNSRGYWTETNSERTKPASGKRYHNPFAYPINTIDKPAAIDKILNWAEEKRIIGIGRWGEWEHMNSDIAVNEALVKAKNIYKRNKQ